MTLSVPSPDQPAAPACAPHATAIARQVNRLAGLPQPPWLHEEVARRLAAKLEPIKLEPTQWLDWSAFLGAGSALVQARYPKARRWVVEPTDVLAQRSQEINKQAGGRGWLSVFSRGAGDVYVSDMTTSAPWSKKGGAQMVWANMTLHATTDLPGLMSQWHRQLAVDGFLMCSGLGPDTARELRALYRQLNWPLPTIDFVDMHDLGDELVRAGFADPVMDMEKLMLTWATPQALLDELRTWGGNVAWGRFEGLRTPRWKQRLFDAIEQSLRMPDGRLGLTVELVYGHAIKPIPRAKVSAETRVSLDDMRTMVKRDQPKT